LQPYYSGSRGRLRSWLWAARSSVTRNIRPGDISSTQKKIPLLYLIILVLTVYWLLSFFGKSIVPGIPPTAGFIDMLAALIVALIIMKFLSQ
jgi:hypothetical protein